MIENLKIVFDAAVFAVVQVVDLAWLPLVTAALVVLIARDWNKERV